MRVAVADVGTNSCHLLIAESHGLDYRVIDALKERTRLGEHVKNGRVTAEGYRRLTQALLRFRELASAAEVSELRVYATSALREADNREEVAQRLRQETGVYPQVISGQREGELTYLGVARSVQLGRNNVLLDLGGGSLEIAQGDGKASSRVLSVPVGAVRMKLRHLKHDPPQQRELNALIDDVTEQLAPHAAGFSAQADRRFFGSSGTFEAVAAMLAARTEFSGRSLNGQVVRTDDLEGLYEQLRAMTPEQRLKVPGLDAKRADIIVAGLAVLHTALRALGAGQVTVSEGALREGMLVEYLQQQQVWSAHLNARERSVLTQLEHFRGDLAHGRKVADLAAVLQQELAAQGVTFPDEAAELLWAGAMLHEVGLLVGRSAHHKHGHYLIRNAELLGFEPWQVELVALLSRYHRRNGPKPTHPELTLLSETHHPMLLQLIAVLRVADGLDRSHTQGVQIDRLKRDGRGWSLNVRNATTLDLQGVNDKADVWAEQFGPLRIDVG